MWEKSVSPDNPIQGLLPKGTELMNEYVSDKIHLELSQQPWMM